MSAYADVARAIGQSGSWVRKFLGRQPVRLDADTYLNIQALYERECARWEAEADAQRARFFALKRGDHAMAEVTAGCRSLDAGCQPDGARSPASLVAALVDQGRR